METRSGTMPHTGTLSSVHHSIVASRSFVPSRAEQMTTPAGMFRGVISSVVTTRFGSTPPARVGMTTASARPEGGLDDVALPRWRVDHDDAVLQVHRLGHGADRGSLNEVHTFERVGVVPLGRGPLGVGIDEDDGPAVRPAATAAR